MAPAGPVSNSFAVPAGPALFNVARQGARGARGCARGTPAKDTHCVLAPVTEARALARGAGGDRCTTATARLSRSLWRR
eukprot:3871187-Alexandrium_andersonii.AAC.1